MSINSRRQYTSRLARRARTGSPTSNTHRQKDSGGGLCILGRCAEARGTRLRCATCSRALRVPLGNHSPQSAACRRNGDSPSSTARALRGTNSRTEVTSPRRLWRRPRRGYMTATNPAPVNAPVDRLDTTTGRTRSLPLPGSRRWGTRACAFQALCHCGRAHLASAFDRRLAGPALACRSQRRAQALSLIHI